MYVSLNYVNPLVHFWLHHTVHCVENIYTLVRGSFLAGKGSWALSGCLTTESADYCILINEWAWLSLPGSGLVSWSHTLTQIQSSKG